jgi:hypothetical protein
MRRGKGHEHDESAWRNSPVGVNAAKNARQRGKAEARRIPAVPSYTGLESTQLRTETLQCAVSSVKEIPARSKDGTTEVAGGLGLRSHRKVSTAGGR